MIRYIKYLFLLCIAVVLILAAVANRGSVTLQLLPAEMAAYLGQPLTFEMPLYAVIFGGIVVGLLIGFVWEWLREHKHRADARGQRREKEKLEREVRGLKRKANSGKDEVLAILDDAAPS